jgi:hypothetical protein
VQKYTKSILKWDNFGLCRLWSLWCFGLLKTKEQKPMKRKQQHTFKTWQGQKHIWLSQWYCVSLLVYNGSPCSIPRTLEIQFWQWPAMSQNVIIWPLACASFATIGQLCSSRRGVAAAFQIEFLQDDATMTMMLSSSSNLSTIWIEGSYVRNNACTTTTTSAYVARGKVLAIKIVRVFLRVVGISSPLLRCVCHNIHKVMV